MLKKLLSKNDCAKCRICCVFDSTDLWEVPLLCEKTAEKIKTQICPEQEFFQKDNNFLMKLNREPDEDLYYCTALDKASGCMLGEDKPFDCKIWPFRVMSLDNIQVITVSPVCPVVISKPLCELIDFAKGIAPTLFDEAQKNPCIIKPYIEGYPILAVKH